MVSGELGYLVISGVIEEIRISNMLFAAMEASWAYNLLNLLDEVLKK